MQTRQEEKMTEKPKLFDKNETQPDTSREGGRSWIFQGPETCTIQYSEIFGFPPSMKHTHEDYEQIIIITAGKADFWCGDEYYELSAGCMMAVPPHVPHGIHQRTDSEDELRIIEIFCPADRTRPESPKIRSVGHINWED